MRFYFQMLLQKKKKTGGQDKEPCEEWLASTNPIIIIYQYDLPVNQLPA